MVPLFQHLLSQLGRDEREAISAIVTKNGAILLLERAKIACQESTPIVIPESDQIDKYDHANMKFERSQTWQESGNLESTEAKHDEGESLSWGDLAQELRNANSLADGLLTGTPVFHKKNYDGSNN